MSIYQIVMTVLTFLFGFLSMYVRSKQIIIDHAKSEIVTAEQLYAQTTKAGEAKFQFVVDSLYGFLPAPMRLFFNKEIIGSIVQTTFETMEKYATQQLDKVVDKLADRIGSEEDEPVEAEG